MQGFSLYQTHTALNLHFGSTDYDYFKYHGKTRVTLDGFKKNQFKWQYAGLEKKLEHVLWFMWNQYKANEFSYLPPKQLIYGGNKWLNQTPWLHPDDYELAVISTDLKWLSSRYAGSTKLVEKGDMYPAIYEDYKEGSIALETILLISAYISNVFTLDQSDDIIGWPMVVADMSKLQPFCLELFERTTFMELFSKAYLGSDK